MRRYTFYLSVALLAFGIGSFVVSNFYWESQNVSLRVENTGEINIFTKRFGDIHSDLNKEIVETSFDNQHSKVNKSTFTCNDKILLVVWNYLKKYPAYRKDAKENFSNCAELFSVSEKIDLNEDGIDEIVVEGIHPFVNGSRGNKSIWFCQKSSESYKVIVEEREQEYKIGETKTNGYQDILLSYRDDCCAFYETIYKFNKGKYRERKCSYVNYGTTGVKEVLSCKNRER